MVFYENTYDEFGEFEVGIQETGSYQITCSGKSASGRIEFEINHVTRKSMFLIEL